MNRKGSYRYVDDETVCVSVGIFLFYAIVGIFLSALTGIPALPALFGSYLLHGINLEKHTILSIFAVPLPGRHIV
jgi:hypothetical protein